MLPWLLQSGFPVIRLSVNSTNALTLTQTPISKYLPNTNPLWWIYLPLRGSSNSGQTFEISAEFQTPSWTISLPQGNWLIEANYNFTGYFGIAYGDQWPAITAHVMSPEFHPTVDRQLLVQSLFYLTRLSHEPLTHYLEYLDAFSPLLASFISGTPDQLADALYVYPIILQQISDLAAVTKTEPAVFQELQNHLNTHFLADAVRALRWMGGDDETLSALRSPIFFWAIYFGLNSAELPIVNQAIHMYPQNGKNLPDDIKSAVYLAVAKYNG